MTQLGLRGTRKILHSLPTTDNLVVLYSEHALNLLMVLLWLLLLVPLLQQVMQLVHNYRQLLNMSLTLL
jgi:hypothetical protein